MKLPSIEYLAELFKTHPIVQTDTRGLQSGALYFALKGPNFNGNHFAIAALKAGAAYAIVDEPITEADEYQSQLMEVEDVLRCLQSLAKWHRQSLRIPFIAITGSNGKTTTKELLTAVLTEQFKTYSTIGNLNNHIGVPLTILSIKRDAEMAVIEMGANHLHEIESYCEYAMPNFGLITNCGKAHLEGFGSEDGVKKAKGELFNYLKAHHGKAFVMQDYDYLNVMSQGIEQLITYGEKSGELQGNAIIENGLMQVTFTKGTLLQKVNTNLVGNYNLPNVLAAVAIGQYFNIPIEKIKKAIENYKPTNSRSQLLDWKDNSILLDAYNANPSSMKAAIDNFASLPFDKKIICLGAMKELGNATKMEHQILVDYLQKFTWKQVVLVGAEFKNCTHPFLYFENSSDAKKWLQAQNFKQHSFLIKGSRSIQMEQLIAD